MDDRAGDRVALLGGTFDPIHLGHMEMIRSLYDSSIVDQVWILPAPTPPHKGEEITPYHHRKEMLTRALDSFGLPARICEIERTLPEPSYTIQTLRALREREPNMRYFLSIGADSLANFQSWREYQALLKMVTLLVARRPGWDITPVAREILDRTILLNHNEVPVSSTDIRNHLSGKDAGEEDLTRWIPKPVHAYILEQNLYRNT